MSNSVDICIATFRRPDLLKNLLSSLERQSIRGKINYRIIIVDNDVGRSAENTALWFGRTSSIDVLYEVAELQGISHARNLALRLVCAPFVAFIDDDEVADPGWLAHLLESIERYQADVVFGPVIPILPEGAPAWSKDHPAFFRPRLISGQSVACGASGNALLKTELLRNFDRWFDTAYALTGGSDTEFFSRMHTSGCRLVWCDEAEVAEQVPVNRLTVRWVCKRAFRGGQTYFRIFIARQRRWNRAIWLTKRATASAAYLLLMPLWLMFGSRQFVVRLCRFFGWVGQLSRMFGNRFEYEEYRAP